ncbi:MAG: 4'-phosphopantetheinyl transferase family protein [Adhaeribacter sp.]
MPLQSIRKINADTVMGLWHLQEPAEALDQQLRALAPAALLFPSFTHASRQQQWLGGRLLAYTLLQELSPDRPLLVAAPGEKPFFEQAGLHLSISHTRSQVAAILSRRAPVGIDLETIHPKVLRVKDKFLTPAEQDLAGQDLNKTLIYWCAKETLYKLHGRKQVLFKEHLQVGPVGSQPRGQLPAGIHTPEFAQDYLVHYEVGTDFILTYCLALPA